MSKAPYIPRSIRTIELRSPKLPHQPNYQEIPQGQATERRSDEATEGDLEATRVPSGPHKGKTLLQLLNDHPAYLLRLREEAFSNDEAFELKVEEFCAKYQHRLDRATGGSAASTLWAASICAFRKGKEAQAGVSIGVWVHEVILIQAADFAQAEALSYQEAHQRFPEPGHQDHDGRPLNIPLAALRRALKAEQPNKGIDLRKSAGSAPSAATPEVHDEA